VPTAQRRLRDLQPLARVDNLLGRPRFLLERAPQQTGN
jgi:hypothetical protein